VEFLNLGFRESETEKPMEFGDSKYTGSGMNEERAEDVKKLKRTHDKEHLAYNPAQEKSKQSRETPNYTTERVLESNKKGIRD